MENIEAHIAKDKQILQDPTTNPQMRRHIQDELHDLKNMPRIIRQRLKRVIITIQHIWNSSVIKIHLNPNV